MIDQMNLQKHLITFFGHCKSGGGSLMMWGCITYDRVGFISRIKGNMDASLYITILDECIPLTQDYYDVDSEDIIFQQDNDSRHTSKKVKDCFKKKGMT